MLVEAVARSGFFPLPRQAHKVVKSGAIGHKGIHLRDPFPDHAGRACRGGDKRNIYTALDVLDLADPIALSARCSPTARASLFRGYGAGGEHCLYGTQPATVALAIKLGFRR